MRFPATIVIMKCCLVLSCGSSDPPTSLFAEEVVEYGPTDSGGFGSENMPDVVLGPPEGGGESSGSTDVLSLGCGGSIVLGFGPPGIVDGAGPDFIVFENAFLPSGGGAPFVEPGEVAVSVDGESWEVFDCIVSGELAPQGCAGVTPVLAHPDNGIDPSDPEVAGGDAFDLADVGLSRANYVRIVDRTEEFYGSRIWCTPPRGGFDLDAVSVVEGQ
jgi:hypothetical protein